MTADRQNTPQDAPHAPVSDFQAPQAPGDATTAPDAAERVQRYAEAIGRQRCEGGLNWLQEARAAMAVADQEQAELRAALDRAESESARLASVVELHKKALNVALNLVGIHPDLHTKDDREALEGCRMVLDDEPAALASLVPDTATPGEADR